MERNDYEYIGCCVSLDGDSVEKMVDDSKEITKSTFLKRVKPEKHDMFNDKWGISFYKSKYEGITCYFVIHSAIEYIWIRS